jgi:hypothetical protein
MAMSEAIPPATSFFNMVCGSWSGFEACVAAPSITPESAVGDALTTCFVPDQREFARLRDNPRANVVKPSKRTELPTPVSCSV